MKRGSLQQNTIMPGDSNFILWKYRGCILATRGHSKTGGGWQLVDILLVYFESMYVCQSYGVKWWGITTIRRHVWIL